MKIQGVAYDSDEESGDDICRVSDNKRKLRIIDDSSSDEALTEVLGSTKKAKTDDDSKESKMFSKILKNGKKAKVIVKKIYGKGFETPKMEKLQKSLSDEDSDKSDKPLSNIARCFSSEMERNGFKNDKHVNTLSEQDFRSSEGLVDSSSVASSKPSSKKNNKNASSSDKAGEKSCENEYDLEDPLLPFRKINKKGPQHDGYSWSEKTSTGSESDSDVEKPLSTISKNTTMKRKTFKDSDSEETLAYMKNKKMKELKVTDSDIDLEDPLSLVVLSNKSNKEKLQKSGHSVAESHMKMNFFSLVLSDDCDGNLEKSSSKAFKKQKSLGGKASEPATNLAKQKRKAQTSKKQDSDNDSEEPLPSSLNRKKTAAVLSVKNGTNMNQKRKHSSSESSSAGSLDKELLTVVNTVSKKHSVRQKQKSDESSSEEPLSKVASRQKLKKTEWYSENSLSEESLSSKEKTKKRKSSIELRVSIDSNDSDEPLSLLMKSKNTAQPKASRGKSNDESRPTGMSKLDSVHSNECEDSEEVSSTEEPLAMIAKKSKQMTKEGTGNNSDDEKSVDGNLKKLVKKETKSVEVSEGSSTEEPLAVKKKPTPHNDGKGDGSHGKHSRKQGSKDSTDDPAIARLKRYIRAVGLFVHYSKVLEHCKSKKKKIQKLIEILEEAGMKGKPTLEKCKKLKAKRERQKEVAELDLGNIISDSGRRRRNVASRYQSFEITDTKNIGDLHQQAKRTFSRLKGIVDSEESD